jgi:uncharacterized protein YqeY
MRSPRFGGYHHRISQRPNGPLLSNTFDRGIMNSMSLKEELENSVKDAMRTGDERRKRTLRMALASIRMAEIEKRGPVDDDTVMAILQKEVKSRQEVIAESEQANRPDLIEEAIAEIAILDHFLPAPFTPEELEALAREAIAAVGATSAREMGQVMKVLMPRLEGRATGSEASQVVRKLLQ